MIISKIGATFHFSHLFDSWALITLFFILILINIDLVKFSGIVK